MVWPMSFIDAVDGSPAGVAALGDEGTHHFWNRPGAYGLIVFTGVSFDRVCAILRASRHRLSSREHSASAALISHHVAVRRSV
jgi:hypothetical protein